MRSEGSCFLGTVGGLGWRTVCGSFRFFASNRVGAASMENVTKGGASEVVKVQFAWQASDFVAFRPVVNISSKFRRSQCVWEMFQEVVFLKLRKCISRDQRGTLWHRGSSPTLCANVVAALCLRELSQNYDHGV